jgi:hypothetical protein
VTGQLLPMAGATGIGRLDWDPARDAANRNPLPGD